MKVFYFISSLFQSFFKWASDSSIQNLSSCMIVRLVQNFMTSGDNIRTNTWAVPQKLFSSTLVLSQILFDLCDLSQKNYFNNLWKDIIWWRLIWKMQLTSANLAMIFGSQGIVLGSQTRILRNSWCKNSWLYLHKLNESLSD